MWQKTFSVRVAGDEHSPGGRRRPLEGALPDVLAQGRRRSTRRWPASRPARSPCSRSRPSRARPVKMSTGVMVIYADRESFTFMTPEGHALSAWITFSAYRDGDDDGRPGPGAGADERPVHRALATCSARTGPTTGSGSRRSRTSPGRSGVAAPVVETAEGLRGQAAAVAVRRQRAPQRRGAHGRRARSRRPPAGCVAGGPTAEPASADRGRDDAVATAGRPRRDRRRRRARTGSPPRSSSPAPAARSGSTRRRTTVGGGTRSAELTLPGFVHDVCASVHPLGLASPFFRSLDLARHGLEWVQPEAPVAHALAPGRSVVLERDLGGRALDEALGARRRRLAPAVRAARRASGSGWCPRSCGPVVAAAPPPAAPGPLRAAGAAAGDGPRPARLPRARGPGAVRRAWPRTRCSGWGSR